MRQWTALLRELQSSRLQSLILPDDIAPALHRALKLVELLATNQFELLLQRFLSHDQDELKSRVRCFLTTRWAMIQNSSLDYMLNPCSPFNKICLKAAALIRRKDEALCQILMPTVKKIVGTVLPPDHIKFASEDLDNHFTPQHFLISDDGQSLISVLDLMEQAQVNPSILFCKSTTLTLHSIDSDDIEKVYSFSSPLSAEDFFRLRSLCGPVSETFFNELEKIHRASCGEKPSVGYALKKLIVALLKSSRVANGSEVGANFSECYQPILAFYAIWSALSHEVTNKIKDYRSQNNMIEKDCLESQLLCLFYGAAIVLSPEAQQRVQTEDVLDCTHRIGETLHSILKYHRDLHDIPLSGKEAEFQCDELVSAEKMAQLWSEFKVALHHRAPIPGKNDHIVLESAQYFEIIARNHFDPAASRGECEEIASMTSTVAGLAIALNLLPKEKYADFLSTRNLLALHILCMDKKSWDAITFILNHIDADKWQSFFDALSVLPHICDAITPADLAKIPIALKNAQMDLFSIAMTKLSCCVLKSGTDIGHLLDIIDYPLWNKNYVLFQHAIDSVVRDDLSALASVFKQIEIEYWNDLATVFNHIIVQQLMLPDFVEQYYSAFKDDQPGHSCFLLFIEMLLPFLDEKEMNVVFIIKLIHTVKRVEWSTLFSTLGVNRVSHCIHNEADFASVLKTIDKPAHRIVFVTAFFKTCPIFKISPQAFYALLIQFPECESAFLKLFHRELPQLLCDFVTTIHHSKLYQFTLPSTFFSVFYFFLSKTLSLLLSVEAIEAISPLFLQSQNEKIIALRNHFLRLETQDNTEHVVVQPRDFQKMQLFSQFLNLPCDTISVGSDRERFSVAIETFFGAHFFQIMLHYHEADLAHSFLQSIVHCDAQTQTDTAATTVSVSNRASVSRQSFFNRRGATHSVSYRRQTHTIPVVRSDIHDPRTPPPSYSRDLAH